MLRRLVWGLWLIAFVATNIVSVQAQEPAGGPVIMAEAQGVINPLTAAYLRRALRLAERQQARALVLILDTPGGLESSMREMVESLLEAPLPTIVYVAPRGARATSAGLFVTLAAHVAAMAPATHIGAAHPVPLGSTLDEVQSEKATSDAAALARAIAATRGRNGAWAEQAVRENLSLTAEEALAQNVIDLLAEDLPILLDSVDGRVVATAAGEVTLRTGGAVIEREPMNLIEQIMHRLADPNIAYLLLSVGVLLLLAELAAPGISVAGIGSAVCFILSFVALGSLPVNWAGVAFVVLAAILFVIGLLSNTDLSVDIAAVVLFVIGSLLLFAPLTPASPAAPTVRVSLWLIGVMAAILLAFAVVAVRALMVARQLPPRSGPQRLVGLRGVALTDLTPQGQVRVEFQDWSAVALDDWVRAGERVEVVGIAGVRLQVRRAREAELPEEGDVTWKA